LDQLTNDGSYLLTIFGKVWSEFFRWKVQFRS